MRSGRSVRVGIVAGEVSGDSLGAAFIAEFKRLYPQARFVGAGGPKMREAGCDLLYEMNEIGLMGLDELFTRLFAILKIRRLLYRAFLAEKLDVFVGVDVPDFNLTLASWLKKTGIPTVHYVSPTVWAWRAYRIRKIRRSVDRMLVLFPFEADYFNKHRVAAKFVGHPIADQTDSPNRKRARRNLAIEMQAEHRLIALLPGSRRQEVLRHGKIMVDAARLLYKSDPTLQFVLPFASDKTRQVFFERLGDIPDLPILFIDGRSREVLEASDFAILASGTAALEAAMMECRHVVVYRVSLLTWAMVKMFGKVQHYSTPNHLLPEPAVPEFTQTRASAERIAKAVRESIDNPEQAQWFDREFRVLRRRLKANASRQVADSVANLLEETAC